MVFDKTALAGKRILVTGGGTGLGKGIAEGLLLMGAAVYICGRREVVLQQAVAELAAKTGGHIGYRVTDIRNAVAVEAMVEGIWQEGPLTGLINNAAANFISPTQDISPRGYAAICSTVMDGSFFTTLSVGKRWIDEGIKGSIVSNLVSWVWTGSAYTVPSAMAKSAIHAMTMSLAVEWGQYGIRLNAVAPGPFPTEGSQQKLDPTGNFGSDYVASVPMERRGEMTELANLVVFLQSDACHYLTGQTIAIDGAHHLAAPSTFVALKQMTAADWDDARAAIKHSVVKEKQLR
ncbi:MAG: SDR family oxidoreductase [Gammaproteobacteria bacterium]|nr:SDR family oxidoreductase [Gammaproteobacteria bacterium]